MKQEEIVTEVFSSLEQKNWENVEKKLSDDFRISGAVQESISKKEWVNFHKAIQAGIPDLKYNLQQVKATGDKVTARLRLTGTHTADLPPLRPGEKPHQKTGKKIELPEEVVEFTLTGDKISSAHVTPVLEDDLLRQIETYSR